MYPASMTSLFIVANANHGPFLTTDFSTYDELRDG
jgi:hypothetical protein